MESAKGMIRCCPGDAMLMILLKTSVIPRLICQSIIVFLEAPTFVTLGS